MLTATPALAKVIATPQAKTMNGGILHLDTGPIANPDPDQTVRQALLSLDPENASGTINSIQINGPNELGMVGTVFQCNPGQVENGVDLIQRCGGPAILRAGKTLRYMAKGKSFTPPEVKLKIILCDNFKGGIDPDENCP